MTSDIRRLICLIESAGSGVTSSANVAVVVGGIGAGFDGDYSKSVYPPPKMRQAKPTIIRRPLAEDRNVGGQLFYEGLDDVADMMWREFEAGTPHQPWQVVSAATLLTLFRDAARKGFVQQTKRLDDVCNRLIQNVQRLYLNTALAEHTQQSTDEVMEQYFTEQDPETTERFVEWAIEIPSGGWRISDYGLDPLVRYACDLLIEDDDLRKLATVSKMLNVTHQRSNLASWFVEGGTASLDRIEHDGTAAVMAVHESSRRISELDFEELQSKRDLAKLLRKFGWVRLAIQDGKMFGWDAGDYTHGDFEESHGDHINLNVGLEDGVPVVEFSSTAYPGWNNATSPKDLRSMPAFQRVFGNGPVVFRDHETWENVPG